MRVLVVTRQLPQRPGLVALLPPGAEVDAVAPDGLAGRSGLAHDAVVLDGPLPSLDARSVGLLADAVERGATLLALGAAPDGGSADAPLAGLLGATAAPGRAAPMEVFATLAGPGSALTARSADEFPVVDVVAPLSPVAADLVPLLTASIGFRHHLSLIHI